VSCNFHFPSQDDRCLGRGAAINKLGIFAVTILAAAGACCGVEARAADAKTCSGLWDFIETDCQLTWYGITLYGVIDAGFTYQTHGCPTDRDRLLTTPAFPRTSKPRGPIRAERGSGTTETVMLASALRAMAR